MQSSNAKEKRSAQLLPEVKQIKINRISRVSVGFTSKNDTLFVPGFHGHTQVQLSLQLLSLHSLYRTANFKTKWEKPQWSLMSVFFVMKLNVLNLSQSI